ncbi:hypothetical protein ACGFMO_31905 [Streptomyces niveus]|uniref:hypothetical protein n=1 Tax=Streptomyces niveus TaxID=193462 RepID=UPI0037161E15
MGRFLSVDPVVDHDAPAQMNAYCCAHNSPVTKSDPPDSARQISAESATPSAAPVGARTIRCATSPRCRRTRPAGMSALHQRQGQGVQPSGQAVRADAEGRRQSECCRGGASRCPRQGRRSRAT